MFRTIEFEKGHEEGRAAFRAGKARMDNPYFYTGRHEEMRGWTDGWMVESRAPKTLWARLNAWLHGPLETR